MNPYRMTEGVFVPAHVAALLSRALDLDRRRVDWRGSHPDVDAVLAAWRQVTLAFVERGTAGVGFEDGFEGETEVADPAKPAAQSPQEMSSTQVADLLDVTEQAVTKAARDKRLPGRRDAAGRWVFAAVDVALYREDRQARTRSSTTRWPNQAE